MTTEAQLQAENTSLQNVLRLIYALPHYPIRPGRITHFGSE